MKSFFQKPYRWAAVFTLLLSVSAAYVLLDTFVIPRASAPAATVRVTAAAGDGTGATALPSGEEDNSGSVPETTAAVTDASYEDENIKITIETEYVDDTAVYIADIQVSDPSYLKTAFANGTYGRNIKQTTSAMAESSGAIFAINGDYYGFRTAGFVLRNGVLYRDTARKSGDDEALVIDANGDFSIVSESRTDAGALADAGVRQILSFGPALIVDGDIAVGAGSEVGQSMSSNPRTAIGQVSALHYIVIVSDGRTSQSAGLSLLELARLFEQRGCTVAYNLDGGGSSTMWFNGQVVNNPTDGRSAGERSVSDIVYIGY